MIPERRMKLGRKEMFSLITEPIKLRDGWRKDSPKVHFSLVIILVCNHVVFVYVSWWSTLPVVTLPHLQLCSSIHSFNKPQCDRSSLKRHSCRDHPVPLCCLQSRSACLLFNPWFAHVLDHKTHQHQLCPTHLWTLALVLHHQDPLLTRSVPQLKA